MSFKIKRQDDYKPRLQEIKERVENQMIFLEGYVEDIHFEDEVEWLIQQLEESGKEIGQLRDSIKDIKEYADECVIQYKEENVKLKSILQEIQSLYDDIKVSDEDFINEIGTILEYELAEKGFSIHE